MMPQVTVIIPAYNQAKYLKDALNSLIDQTFEDWECIIINDGSTDDTGEVIRSYAGKDSRICYVEQANSGLAAARNRGLEKVKGRYIQFLDSDDALHKNKLQLQLALLSQTKELALSYSDYFTSIENDLSIPHSLYLTPKFNSNNLLYDLILRWETEISIPIHCFLFDARFFNKHKIIFDENLPNHEDWDCWIKIFSLKPKIYYIDHKLATYRIHNESMVRDKIKMKRGFIQAIHNQRQYYNKKSIEYALLTEKIKITKKCYKRPNIFSRFLHKFANKIKKHFLY